MTDLDINEIEDFDLMEWILSEKPIPAARVGFEAVLQCVKNHSAFVFYWTKNGRRVRLVVDALTSNMLKTVYDGVNDDTKAKMDELTRKSRAHFVALVDRCWKCVK